MHYGGSCCHRHRKKRQAHHDHSSFVQSDRNGGVYRAVHDNAARFAGCAADAGRPAAQIANMHTIFNIGTTLLLLPAGNLLAGMAEHLLPDKKSESLAAEQRKAACKKVEDVWNS